MVADLLMWTLSVAWKVLTFVCGWMLIKYIVRHGKGTFRDILDTVHMGIQALCAFGRRKLLEKLRKEANIQEPEKPGAQEP